MCRIAKICCLLILLQWHFPGQAQTAFLSAEQVYEGDIAELVIEYNSKIPSLYALDLSVLNTDFEVLDVRSGLARVIVAEEMFHRMQWKIDILPRRSGRLSIPSIKVGDLSTPELKLEVARQSSELLSRQNVFIEIEAQPDNPYVGQPSRIIMRLLHNLPVSAGNLLEPGADNMEVYRNHSDARYLVNRDGMQFNVLERSIVLVAQSSGAITLSPANYRGRIDTESMSTGADPALPSRRIYRNSEVLQLQVRTPPPSFSGNAWLPAQRLELSQRWDTIEKEFKVGDSLGLNLTIEAWGLPAETLPADLVSSDSDQFRIYADQAVRSNRFESDVLVGRLEQRFAVVVSQPGEVMLPTTILKWWDVNRDVERVAQLDGKNLIVTKAAIQQSGLTDLSLPDADLFPPTQSGMTLMRSNWRWIALFSLPLIACILLLVVTPLRQQISGKIESVLSAKRNLRALKKACMTNDPLNARCELLIWGRRRWPGDNINGINQIGARTGSTEFGSELSRLDRALYAQHTCSWQGRRLWRIVASAPRCYPATPDFDQNSLPELYSQTNLSTR